MTCMERKCQLLEERSSGDDGYGQIESTIVLCDGLK